MIKEVLSRVDPVHYGFRDVSYEWDEEIANYFGVPIRQIFFADKPVKNNLKQSLKKQLKKIFLHVPALRQVFLDSQRPVLTQDINMPLSVCFVMFPAELSICEGNNCLPILLDIWDDFHFMEVIRRTKNLKLFYVTSRDAYNKIKELSPTSKVCYMPQSISDKYYSENFTAYRNKIVDVVQIGRRNPLLHEYMLRYISMHENIEYVYTENGEGVSSLGRKTWPLRTRNDYMKLLAASKVSLTGCSGVDNARENTFGICFITPRFYEAAISGCALISRYPDNQEFRELNASRYFPNVKSYEHFTECLEHALAQTPEELYAQNHEFIINSLTSKRAEQIQRDLENLTCGILLPD